MTERGYMRAAGGVAVAALVVAVLASLFACGGGCPRATTTNPQPNAEKPCPRGR